MEDAGLVIKRVNALDGASPDAEQTLMDGYALALALEGEHARLERRFAQLSAAVVADRNADKLPELSALRRRMSSTEAELQRLRSVLQAVRRRLMTEGASAAAEAPARS